MGASKKHRQEKIKEAAKLHVIEAEHGKSKRTEPTESSQYGLCRCCLAMGFFKPMQCGNTGAQMEGCAEMLYATFSIALPSQYEAVPSDPLICETCEMRLCDAYIFKQQVLEAQDRHEQQNQKLLINDKIDTLKIESVKMEVECELRLESQDGSDVDKFRANAILHSDVKTKTAASVNSKAKKNKKIHKKVSKKFLHCESMKTNPKLLSVDCKFCHAKIPPMYSDFIDHMQTEHSLGAIKQMNILETSECDVCKRIFSTCRQRALHVRNRHFKCLKCLKVFRNVYERDEHKETHPAKCRLCKEVFPTKKLLESHKNSAHNYRCRACMAHFDNDKALMKHKITAHGEPKHECRACNKSFYFRAHLTKHQRKDHLMERNISCTECDYTAYGKWELNKHMVRHSNVKQHECNYCKKRFARANTLRYHTRIHTGDKRQVCQLCSVAFVQRASLKYHLEKYHPEQQL